MSDIAVRVEDLGIKFSLAGNRSASVSSSLVRFFMRSAPPKEFWALRNISFEVPAGQVLGIIGHNGSGKSTLLRTLARIYAPDEGFAEIRGRTAALISLGAGFQPNLTGIENIRYNALLLGLSKQDIERRLDDIVAFADIGDFINAPVRTYSSGMRARLGFSVAVHVDPEILIVDEFIGVGDAKFRAKCRTKFREFFRKGVTVVMVQHNLDAILTMCHECIWLDHGKMMGRGDPREMVDAYLESQGIDPEEANALGGDQPDASYDAGGGGYVDTTLL